MDSDADTRTAVEHEKELSTPYLCSASRRVKKPLLAGDGVSRRLHVLLREQVGARGFANLRVRRALFRNAAAPDSRLLQEHAE